MRGGVRYIRNAAKSNKTQEWGLVKSGQVAVVFLSNIDAYARDETHEKLRAYMCIDRQLPVHRLGLVGSRRPALELRGSRIVGTRSGRRSILGLVIPIPPQLR